MTLNWSFKNSHHKPDIFVRYVGQSLTELTILQISGTRQFVWMSQANRQKTELDAICDQFQPNLTACSIYMAAPCHLMWPGMLFP